MRLQAKTRRPFPRTGRNGGSEYWILRNNTYADNDILIPIVVQREGEREGDNEGRRKKKLSHACIKMK